MKVYSDRCGHLIAGLAFVFVLFSLSAPLISADLSQLLSLEFEREGEGVVMLTLELDRTTSWSTVRNTDGQLVLELWETVPASFVEVPVGAIQGVRVLSMQTQPDGPVTRLTIADAGAEYELTPAGLTLRAKFYLPSTRETDIRPELERETEGLEPPVAETGTELEPTEYQPEVEASPIDVVALPEVVAPAAQESEGFDDVEASGDSEARGTAPEPSVSPVSESSGVRPSGTPSHPYLSPLPPGPAAKVLIGVDLLPSGAGYLVRADGAIRFSAFNIIDPDRFVLDLVGLDVVTVERELAGSNVEPVTGVRVGQFTDQPVPIARVVFDLTRAAVPIVESGDFQLLIRFTDANEPRDQPLADTAMVSAEQASSAVTTVEVSPGRFQSMPAGKLASNLLNASWASSKGVGELQLQGDGGFHYGTFVLSDPDRFVIDLIGVSKVTSTESLVASGVVQKVRLGVFESEPKVITRVVFDLTQSAVPSLERSANGLTVRFQEAP